MVAVVKVMECSASRTGVDKTSSVIRFKDAHNTTVDTSNPVVIPSAGDTTSFTKQLRLYVATAPDTQIDNLRVYTDGTLGFGTGVAVNASNNGVTFVTATRRQIATADFFAYVVGTPFDLDSVASAALTASGFGGDLLCLQLVVQSTASSGSKTPETITFAYDEI